MSVRIEIGDDVIVCFLEGELDHHAAANIRQQIDLAVEQHHPKLVALDFSGVSFMDSSGIGLVMGRYQMMKLIGGDVVVQNPSAYIRKVMRVAGLDRLVKFIENASPLSVGKSEKTRPEKEG